MKEALLTEQDRGFISQIVCDEETGNHWLRNRDELYWFFRRQLYVILSQPINELDDKEKEIIDFYHACQDPQKMKKYNEKYKIEKE